MSQNNSVDNNNVENRAGPRRDNPLPKKAILIGIAVTLMIGTGITLGAIYLKKGKKVDKSDSEKIIETPEQLKKEKIERVQSIVNKLINLGLTVEININIREPTRPGKDSDDYQNVSNSTYIRLSEIVAIVEDYKDKEPKLQPAKEADAIMKFKKFIGKYGKKYKNVGHFLERYGYFRVNYKEIEKHNESNI